MASTRRSIACSPPPPHSKRGAGRSSRSEALATWGIKVLVVELDEDVRDGIRAAQVRQQLVNPEALAPPNAELD